MMQPWQVIQQLESDNSRIHKEGILKAVMLQQPDDWEFWTGCRLALSGMVTFGIKQVPIHEGPDGPGLDFETFEVAAEGFTLREYTGNKAKGVIDAMMAKATREQWNDWYRRILIKDLRCGITETTINKVRPGTVDVFSCQLAKDAADNEAKLKGRKLLDYKLDGVRVLAVIRIFDFDGVNGHGNAFKVPLVTLHSRNGKVFENFTHIEQQLTEAAKDLESSWVLDGEITSASFQDLMTQVHRKRNADASDAVFNVFDAIPYEAFRGAGHYAAKQDLRSSDLKGLFGHFMDCPNVKRLAYWEADLDTEEGRAKLEEMRDKAAELGLEGVMVKDADAPYECKRTASWLKIKPNITVDLKVIDIEPGTGRNEGRLGALVCEGTDDGRRINVNVGSGYSDALRDSIWNNRTGVLGHTVEVKADAVTQNQDGSYSLRFPRFVRFRGFEPGEKL